MHAFIMELIGGGAVWAVALVALVARPKALVTVLVCAAAPFKGSRLFDRWSKTLRIICGGNQSDDDPTRSNNDA